MFSAGRVDPEENRFGLLRRPDHTFHGNLFRYYDPGLKEARLAALDRAAEETGSSYAFSRADLADRAAVEAVFAAHRFDRVINLAAQAGVRYSLENPRAYVCVFDIPGQAHWVLQLEFQRSETEGPIFDAMDMQIEAIASMVGLKGIFKLRSADIYRVISVTKNVDERFPRSDFDEPAGQR